MPQNRTYSFSALFSFKIDHTFFFLEMPYFFHLILKMRKMGISRKKHVIDLKWECSLKWICSFLGHFKIFEHIICCICLTEEISFHCVLGHFKEPLERIGFLALYLSNESTWVYQWDIDSKNIRCNLSVNSISWFGIM